MWLAENESASFWMTVLTDLKARGVNDILIACTDNLTGFTQAIKGVFPNTVTQLCIVHQIRNSCKFVVWKDRKEFCSDLKAIYGATNEDSAQDALKTMDNKWGAKYKYAIQSWQTNWENLTQFYRFPMEIPGRADCYLTAPLQTPASGVTAQGSSRIGFANFMTL